LKHLNEFYACTKRNKERKSITIDLKQYESSGTVGYIWKSVDKRKLLITNFWRYRRDSS